MEREKRSRPTCVSARTRRHSRARAAATTPATTRHARRLDTAVTHITAAPRPYWRADHSTQGSEEGWEWDLRGREQKREQSEKGEQREQGKQREGGRGGRRGP
eukprot:3560825-Rhodomonas_salina.2